VMRAGAGRGCGRACQHEPRLQVLFTCPPPQRTACARPPEPDLFGPASSAARQPNECNGQNSEVEPMGHSETEQCRPAGSCGASTCLPAARLLLGPTMGNKPFFGKTGLTRSNSLLTLHLRRETTHPNFYKLSFAPRVLSS